MAFQVTKKIRILSALTLLLIIILIILMSVPGPPDFVYLLLGVLVINLVVVLLTTIVCSRKRRDEGEEEEGMELNQLPGMPKRFTYKELQIATGDFKNKLGEGGFGSVFEGSLQTEHKIAVKKLEPLGQGKREFLAELKSIGSIHHNNLVRLIGYCVEKQHRLLVYEFMCNGSLDDWIFHKRQRPPLDWQIRKKIILEIAKGLAYLHDDCRQRIVHLDIKPQNILLDSDLHIKISDFGLSKLIERDQSQVNPTTMRGTPGYMAPELVDSIVTEKADVYSFGVVVMKVVCGRKNIDKSNPEEFIHLLPIFMKNAQQGRLPEIVEPNIENKSEAVEIMSIAHWCLQIDHKRRPSMAEVVKVLEVMMDKNFVDGSWSPEKYNILVGFRQGRIRRSSQKLKRVLKRIKRKS